MLQISIPACQTAVAPCPPLLCSPHCGGTSRAHACGTLTRAAQKRPRPSDAARQDSRRFSWKAPPSPASM
eukprot:358035-Chlamydomonas_euryale.AAC.4